MISSVAQTDRRERDRERGIARKNTRARPENERIAAGHRAGDRAFKHNDTRAHPVGPARDHDIRGDYQPIVRMSTHLDAVVRRGNSAERERRARLAPAVEAAGFRIDASQAGLYLWATDGGDAWGAVARLAELGILVVPGDFYGPAGAHHVRIALTATDAAIDKAVTRLATLS